MVEDGHKPDVVERVSEDVDAAESRAEEFVAKDRGYFRRDNFGLVFVLILATLVSTALVGTNLFGSIGILLLQSATLIAALRASAVRPRTMVLGSIAILVAFAGVALSIASGIDSLGRSYSVVMLALVAVAPVVIGGRLLDHQKVTMQTVWGALSIYLLIGLFFGVVYGEMQRLAGPFFNQTATPSSSDFIYYSFTTQTTLGYGDFTAASPIGRLLSITEALLGQIYLVTIIALLVSRIGEKGPGILRETKRSRRGRKADKS